MIPLLVRSHHSLMRGTASVPAIVSRARDLGYTTVALTDTDNLYGLWPFLHTCRDMGLKPVVGAEITDPRTSGKAVCLVRDPAGYRNLCRLLTQRHIHPTFQLRTDLPRFSEGLLVLTSCVSLLAFWRKTGLAPVALTGRYPLHGSHPLVREAREWGLPVAAFPDASFIESEDVSVYRLRRAIALNTTVSRMKPEDKVSSGALLIGPPEHRSRFAVCPEAIQNAEILAGRIEFSGPEFGTVMPPWTNPDGCTPSRVLRRDTYAGARGRYGPRLPGPVVRRMEEELRIIHQMGFDSYFLVVRDIVQTSPRTCGRGSGAASLVAYCLGITNVCPIRNNLYFERFLNPGRRDPPDIDVDFAWDERDNVIQNVLSRFSGHSAMVSSHILFQPRMALRETARVFGLPESEIGRVTRRLPWFWQSDDPEADLYAEIQTMPETRHLSLEEPWPRILKLAGRIIGIPRCLSVHPGGVVITPDPIDQYVPVQQAVKGVAVIQWDKDGAEDAGLVKIDLLGNRSLGVIRDTLGNVRENGGVLDESRWDPEEDPATRETIAAGRTMGCFYIESPAMRLLQQKAGVGDFPHLVIHSSIIRPAANPYIREYIRRLHGGSWEPIHPLLAKVLGETFGIMVYQEDVSRTAVALAGFSHTEADRLRKIMSKKDREQRLPDFQKRFFEGARARGVTDKQIGQIWEMMMSFDGYSFCKPHSASYARVSFQAAWLKTHFPAEFMAAVISNQGGYYSSGAYVSEARRLGLVIFPPDIRYSRWEWTGYRKNIRVGLLSVRGLSRDCVRRIITCRSERPFHDVCDFLDRVHPDRNEARALIRCGSMDSLSPGSSRSALAWLLAAWEKNRGRHGKSHRIFDRKVDGLWSGIPEFPPESREHRLEQELDTLGFLCDRHPMSLYGSGINPNTIIRALDLPRHVGRRIQTAGWLITAKQTRTRKGHPMEFVSFEDETGMIETVFFPETYRRYCHLLDEQRPYLLSGKVEADYGVSTLTVACVRPIAVSPLSG